jgi:hypothetical protein
MQSILRWFRFIKTYDGKKENTLYKDGKFFSKEETQEIVHKHHSYWRELKSISEASPNLRDKLEQKRREFHFI